MGGLLLSFSLLLLFACVSLTYLFVAIWREGSLGNNYLELFYMAIHIVILVTGIFLSKEGMRRGSNIMRSLMYSRYGRPSIPARIISSIFIAVGIVSFVYSLLIIMPIGIYDFGFPLALKWDLLNVGLTLSVVGIFFFLFPFELPSEIKKEELEAKR